MHEFPPPFFEAMELYVNRKIVTLFIVTVVAGALSIKRAEALWSRFAWGGALVGSFLMGTNRHIGLYFADFQSRIWSGSLQFTLLVISLVAVARILRAGRRDQSLQPAGLVVAGGICAAVYCTVMFPRPNAAREAAARTQCKNNLKQIGLAMHNYHDVFHAFPMATSPKPERSWRVTILPYCYQEKIYERYDQDQPWDSETNSQLQPQRIHSYDCPTRPAAFDSNGNFLSAYSAVTGAGTVFDRNKSTKIREITDGKSNTLMVVESCGRKIVWTQPQDISTAEDEMSINGPGATVGQSASVSSSYHTGGSQVLLADGSVRFVSENIDPKTLRSLTTRAGGEVLPEW